MTAYPVFGERRQRIRLNIVSCEEKEAARWSMQHIRWRNKAVGWCLYHVHKKQDSRMVYVSCHWRNKAARCLGNHVHWRKKAAGWSLCPLENGQTCQSGSHLLGAGLTLRPRCSQRWEPPGWSSSSLVFVVRLFLVHHLLCFQSVSEAAGRSWVPLHPHPGPQHLHSPPRSSA